MNAAGCEKFGGLSLFGKRIESPEGSGCKPDEFKDSLGRCQPRCPAPQVWDGSACQDPSPTAGPTPPPPTKKPATPPSPTAATKCTAPEVDDGKGGCTLKCKADEELVAGKCEPKDSAPTTDTAADEQRAVSECDQLYANARSTCQQVAQVNTQQPSRQMGIKELCDEWKRTGQIGAQANLDSGSSCTSAYNQCQNSCTRNAQLYSRVADRLRQTSQACGDLSAYVQRIGQQSQNILSSTDMARYCGQSSGADPSSLGGGPGGGGGPGLSDPYSQANNYGNQSACDMNPNSAACAEERKAKEPPQGKAGFGSGDDQGGPKPSDFNITDPKSLAAGTQGPTGDFKPKPGLPGATVANNAGGQIPGSGGDSGGAKLDPPRPGGVAPASYSTDIMQGYVGASPTPGYNGAAEPSSAADFQAYYRRGKKGDPDGLDLKQFLPGGRQAVRRGLGGQLIRSEGIHGPGVDIWARISQRMTEKCKLGMLFGCKSK
ncbi:MAG: hypothetical protein AB7F86_11405 [Bdellovibrionales bacterium]